MRDGLLFDRIEHLSGGVLFRLNTSIELESYIMEMYVSEKVNKKRLVNYSPYL